MTDDSAVASGGESISNWSPLFWSVDTNHVQSTLAIAEPYTACTAIQNDVSGKFVLVGRGDCLFAEKAAAAQSAGAVGVIIVNNDQAHPDDVIPMWDYRTAAIASIPVLMVSYNSGAQIQNLGSDISVEFTGRCGNSKFLLASD